MTRARQRLLVNLRRHRSNLPHLFKTAINILYGILYIFWGDLSRKASGNAIRRLARRGLLGCVASALGVGVLCTISGVVRSIRSHRLSPLACVVTTACVLSGRRWIFSFNTHQLGFLRDWPGSPPLADGLVLLELFRLLRQRPVKVQNKETRAFRSFVCCAVPVAVT